MMKTQVETHGTDRLTAVALANAHMRNGNPNQARLELEKVKIDVPNDLLVESANELLWSMKLAEAAKLYEQAGTVAQVGVLERLADDLLSGALDPLRFAGNQDRMDPLDALDEVCKYIAIVQFTDEHTKTVNIEKPIPWLLSKDGTPDGESEQ